MSGVRNSGKLSHLPHTNQRKWFADLFTLFHFWRDLSDMMYNQPNEKKRLGIQQLFQKLNSSSTLAVIETVQYRLHLYINFLGVAVVVSVCLWKLPSLSLTNMIPRILLLVVFELPACLYRQHDNHYSFTLFIYFNKVSVHVAISVVWYIGIR